MRAAATVGRLMPSPMKRMILRALGAPDARACAAAAPARNHQAAVSPSGRAIAGTTISAAGAAPVAPVGAGVLAQAASVTIKAGVKARCMGGKAVANAPVSP